MSSDQLNSAVNGDETAQGDDIDMRHSTEYWNPVGGELFLQSHFFESEDGAENRGWDDILSESTLALARQILKLREAGATSHEIDDLIATRVQDMFKSTPASGAEAQVQYSVPGVDQSGDQYTLKDGKWYETVDGDLMALEDENSSAA